MSGLRGNPGRLFPEAGCVALLAGYLLCMFSSPATAMAASRIAASETESAVAAAAVFGSLPLSFIPNAGQLDSSVRYYGHGQGFGVYFTSGSVIFAFPQRGTAGRPGARQILGLEFLGAREGTAVEGREQGVAKVNYLIGNDSTRWRTGLPTYHEVVYRELWPGIDLLFRQTAGRFKYEFLVQPGARLEDVRLAYRGAEGVSVDSSGNLLIRTSSGTLVDQAPTSYQVIGGRRAAVQSRFALAHHGDDVTAYGFAVGREYDPRLPLIIDPGFQLGLGDYSALVGGTGSDIAYGVAVDPAGNAYIVGQTDSSNLPVTAGVLDQTFGGGSKSHGFLDAFVAKLNPDGTVAFVTYLGGSDTDVGLGIAVDASGNAVVTGYTYSSDFPTTGNAFSRKITGGTDAFAAKLNATGSGLLYSTFLGGGGFDAGHAIALDAAGNIYVTGETLSSNFPITPFAVFAKSQGKRDAFITKLNPSSSGSASLVYSTYLGGNGDDVGFGIAVDPGGNAYVTGQTSSPNLPATAPAPALPYDSSLNGPSDAFVAKLNAGGSALVYLTYLGGSADDAGYAIALGCPSSTSSSCNASVAGQTMSSNFPTAAAGGAAPYDSSLKGSSDAFVAQLNASGSALVYSTYLGGSADDAAFGIAVDGAGAAYLTGWTTSSDLSAIASANALEPSYNGNGDAFIAKLNPGGSALLYFTYLGGGGTDVARALACMPPTGYPSASPGSSCGSVWVSGNTNSGSTNPPAFPTTLPPALNLNTASDTNPDAFVVRLAVRTPTSTAVTSSTNPSVSGQSVAFTATVSAAAGAGAPTGSVSLFDGGTLLGTATLSPSTSTTSTATLATSNLTASGSPHSITAVYGGDGTFAASTSAALSQTVNKANTSTTVTSSTNPSVFGQSVTFTATVTAAAPGSGTPTGTLTFSDGAVTLGTGTLDATGHATLPVATLSVNSHTITAQYAGSTNFNASTPSAAVTQTVGQASTTAALTVSPSAPVVGQAVTLTATVAAAPPGAGTPTGTVTFFDGATQLGTATLSSGQASLTTSALAVGAHSFSATYGGDGNFTGSTGRPSVGTFTISPASTATALTSALSPSVVGQAVTFTATVTVLAPGTGTPGGNVTFSDGGTALGSGALNASGQAAITTAALSVGAHAITAQYTGSTSFSGSTSPPLSQTVNPGLTTIALTASAPSSTVGQSLVFTATVSAVAPASGIPTGTVTFLDYNNQLGISALDNTGTATLTATSLGVGLHSISATYNGSASFLTVTSAALSGGILSQPVISAPTVQSTDRTSQQPLGALYLNCKSQFVTLTGNGFLPPTTFPPNIGIGFTPSGGITVTEVDFLSSTTLVLVVDVDASASTTSRSITVTNPDTGTGTSAGTILDVGNPRPCPAQGLAPSTTSSGTATPPVISSLVPISGLRGSSVTVNGSNFGSAPVVTFTGPANTPVIATIKSSTSTALTVTVPIFPTNSADAFDGPVFVTNNGLASNGIAFTVTNPRLSVVTPSSAPPGLITLDLAGTKLQSGATAQFLNAGTTTPASGLVVNSATSDGTGQHLAVALTATAVTGSLDVLVTNPDGGTSKLPGAFQVTAPPAAGFTFAVAGANPAAYLPSVDGVSVTLDSTGKCTAKSITPHAVTLTANFATTVGALPPSQVTFTIASSNLPGTATNEDCELVSPAASDFSINLLGALPDVTIQQLANVPDSGGGTYSVTLYSWDWGGNVAISVSGVTTVNGVANATVNGTLKLPVDTDGDKLPDAYEANALLNGNAAGQNVLDRLNKDQNGNGIADGDDRFTADGLSNFQKYRGVYLSGPANGATGPMTAHISLGSGLRHLFVRGRGFGNDPVILAAPGTCGITVGPLGPSDPTTGTPLPDPNPCPVFEVGPGFFAAGVQVHDVSASFTTSTTFPRQSLANPASATLDMATILYDGTNCGSAAGCNTAKTGARNWNPSPLGVSSYGTLTAYGSDSRVLKLAVDHYFSDKPYQHRAAGLSACTASSTTPCFVLAPDGTTPMLTPLTLVGDISNDDGTKDTSKEVVDASGNLLGDTYVAGLFNLQLTAMDANNDGCVELPFLADPRGVPRCSPNADSALSPQATKQQVVRSLITHELGHNIGINTHTTDSTDIMYQYTINWIRDGHFSSTAAGLIQIHNAGVE